MSQGPVPIIDANGVHPSNLDQAALEQQLWNQGRFRELYSTNSTFVFGSNEAGVHGAGAARYAMQKLGAVYGVGFGPTGKCYALPSKDHQIRTLPLWKMEKYYVPAFLKYAREHPGETFKVTQIGCGLAGFKAEQIAPMFADAPPNCFFDTAWLPYLSNSANFWGHQ